MEFENEAVLSLFGIDVVKCKVKNTTINKSLET